MSSTEEESKPFLNGDHGQHDRYLGQNRRRRRDQLLHVLLFVFHTAFFILNAALFIHASPSQISDPDDFKTFSPVRSAVRYKVQDFQYSHGRSSFIGEPRPELDQAWSKLLSPSVIRITESEMRKMNKTSVAIRDGSGYLGYIEAIHMLHCVKRIHQSQYPEHYPDLKAEGELDPDHLGHCLEILREGILCNADVTVNTYHWDPNRPGRFKGNRGGARKCTDWDGISAWLETRHLDAIGNQKFLSTLVPGPGTEGP
ncbi:hypothetical protein QBC43DRAFT_223636 [Cladorrhinum sp. PSN259]|nr:hypothetical protein QBC43DRAFT_223636 [Cladorrhinum sp. PSN259]